jgi:hypothetical protein
LTERYFKIPNLTKNFFIEKFLSEGMDTLTSRTISKPIDIPQKNINRFSGDPFMNEGRSPINRYFKRGGKQFEINRTEIYIGFGTTESEKKT